MFNSRAPNRQIKASGQMKIKTYSRRQNLKGKIIQLNQMIRIIFWIFVALFLAAFFWGASASKNWTEQENAQFWTGVVCFVWTLVAGGLAYLLFYCWKKRAVPNPARYGFEMRAFSRDSEPFHYWSVMIFYSLFLILVLLGLTKSLLSFFGIEITFQEQAAFMLFFGGLLSFLPFAGVIGAFVTGRVGRYEWQTNPVAYSLVVLFCLATGVFFFAFRVLCFLHPQHWK
jgi:hypothetical protein